MTLAIQDWRTSDLLSPEVRVALERLPDTLIHGVTRNEEALADTYKWAEVYDISLAETANVVVLETRKSKNAEREFAAVLVLADSRADLNGAVKKTLGIYKASFAPTDKAVAATGMESGGMSPIGLPADWPLLIDARVLDVKKLYLGSGLRRSKLVVDGSIFTNYNHAVVADIAITST